MAGSKTLSRRLLLIPLGLGVVFGVLSFLPFWTELDYAVYDLFLHLKPAIAEDKSLVLLDVDDESVMRIGTWPWPRGNFAQGLEALSEFNASYAVFDIEYIEKSPTSVDQSFLDTTLKARFNQNFKEIKSSVFDLFSAVSQRSITMADLPSYSTQLTERIGEIEGGLYQDVRQVSVENDSYLGKSMQLFGKSFVTLNMLPDFLKTTNDDLRQLARERFKYPAVEHPEFAWSANKDFLIPVPEVTRAAAGAGFTNVTIDKDGSRRRIRILNNVDGQVYLQLAMRPLADRLGTPRMVLEPGTVIFKDALLNGVRQDIRIPVDAKGEMLINWPKKTFRESFTHESFYRLLDYREKERELGSLLSSLATKSVWDLIPGKNPIGQVTKLWDACEADRQTALDSGLVTDRQAFISAKNDYYDVLGQLAASSLDGDVLEYLHAAKAKDSKANAPLYDQLEASLVAAFKDIRSLIGELTSTRNELASALAGTTCLIGFTAIASTDFGVNPFAEQYANVGTHAAVINTILQQKFLVYAPSWVSALLCVGLAFGLIILIQRMKTAAQILVGIGSTAALFLVLLALFVLSGVYVPATAPLLAVFLSFLAFTLAVFFMTEQEKSFLRKAFSTYLSADVIEQIVKDPAMLKLGGQKKWISAMFTDVRGFSTISEKMEPEQLVRLLNLYLSGMSDLIMAKRGTIDKFEGDAIISFFGAPVDYANHAEMVCAAAILMKRKEAELNAQFLAEALSPTPLHTRIGINTGDMVVGNMGTEKKMDYTIMGNAVNLAARLEGVNKQYGTWILATETTRGETGDIFAWRRLDRVRVVGINQPLRLYELVDFRADLAADKQAMLASFDQALEIFEARQWQAAAAAFEAIQAGFPDDGPCKTYLKRCKEFMETPPAPEWEGVFNLTEK